MFVLRTRKGRGSKQHDDQLLRFTTHLFCLLSHDSCKVGSTSAGERWDPVKPSRNNNLADWRSCGRPIQESNLLISQQPVRNINSARRLSRRTAVGAPGSRFRAASAAVWIGRRVDRRDAQLRSSEVGRPEQRTVECRSPTLRIQCWRLRAILRDWAAQKVDPKAHRSSSGLLTTLEVLRPKNSKTPQGRRREHTGR